MGAGPASVFAVEPASVVAAPLSVVVAGAPASVVVVASSDEPQPRVAANERSERAARLRMSRGLAA
jgi:hypothetical protein